MNVASPNSTAEAVAAGAASPELLRILAAAGDTFFTLDHEWRFTALSRGTGRYSRERSVDLLGRSLWEAYPELVGTVFETEYRRAVAERRIVHFEAPGVLTGKWFDVYACPSADGLTVYSREVTARKLAEARLRDSEETLRLALRAAGAGMYVWDVAADHAVWDEQTERLFGVPPGSYDGTVAAFLQCVHPEDRDFVRHTVEQAVARGACYDMEYRIVWSDGSVHWIAGKGQAIAAEGGSVRRMVGLSQDVTARKQVEARLRESEERHRTLCELSSDYTYVCRLDADDRAILESASEGFTRVTGYAGTEELEERGGWMALIHPDDMPKVEAAYPARLAGYEGPEEVRIRTRQGAVRWIRYSARRVWDAGRQRIVGLLGAVQDVTARKEAEQALRESEERLQRFFEAAFEGIAIHEGGVLVDVNRSLAEMFGCEPAELIGRPAVDLAAPEQRALVQARIAAGDERPYEAVGLRQDGTTFPGELRGKAIVYRGRPARVVAVRDVSARKDAEAALQESARRLQSLSHRLLEVQEAERRHLACELHDEVGQLLTGLKLTLEASARRGEDHLRAGLHEAQVIARDLTARVRDLSLRLRPTMLDDLGLLPALLWLCERYTAQTGVRVAFEHSGLGRRLPPEAETAAYRIVQEALTNVARHAGVAEATVCLGCDADTLTIRVEDRGAGFDLDAVRGAGRCSTGLSGIEERVELLAGRLTLQSRPGAGTRLRAELPLGEGRGRKVDAPEPGPGR